LNKENRIDDFSNGTFTWKMGGAEICSIGYTIYSNKMTLHYKYRLNGASWNCVDKDIIFDTTKCNYGGIRRWFLCSGCGRRVAILYYLSGEFLCRHCHNLTYASQREHKEARMMRKARKIRNRLGASDNLFEPIWDKPKYMHQVTFDRLKHEAEVANRLSWGNLEKIYAKKLC
jgi:hypothetical protein